MSGSNVKVIFVKVKVIQQSTLVVMVWLLGEA